MPEWESARHRTAISRAALSVPARQALLDGVMSREHTVLDYGAGRGLDTKRLSALGFRVHAWDPHFAGDSEPVESDVVMMLYVLNVIEDPAERVRTLAHAWALTRSVLVVSARLVWDARRVSGDSIADGVMTSRGTFQHLYKTEELRRQVEQVTGVRGFVAAPGVVYAFRPRFASSGVIVSSGA